MPHIRTRISRFNKTAWNDDVNSISTLMEFIRASLLLFQGPTWEGRSGVHSHMTNTRITDPEILERR